MVPPIGIPDDRPPFIDDRFEDIMERLKGIEDQYSSGIGGLQDKFDNLPVPIQPPEIDYDFLTKRIQDNIDLPPSIDRDMLMKDIMKNIDIPKPPSIDRNALIDEIRSGITMPDMSGYATIDDLNKGIGGINIPNYDDSSIRDMINNIPSYDDSGIRDLINKNTGAIGNIPSYDDSSIRDLIGGIDNKYSTGLDELNRNIGNIPSYDDSSIRDLINKNTGAIGNIPSYDDSSIRDLINKNTGAIGNIPSYDDSSIRDLINKNTGAIGSIPSYDDSAIRNLIGDIDNKYSTGLDELNRNIGNISSYDDSSIRDLINANAGAIASLPTMKLPVPTRATGMETLVNRVPKGR